MRIVFCGVRGSTPSPGREFIRYGGNTSCVAISRNGGDPSLVLDGGTGLRRLTSFMEGRPFDGTVLIGHLHWDHTHGLPFFRSGDHPQARVRVLIPEQGDASEVMARAVSPPHFPLRIEELQGDWSVGSIDEGEHDVEGFRVLAREIPHKMSRTFGFRVTDGEHSIAYLSDHWPSANGNEGEEGLGEYHDAAVALARDVDLLIHDAQYTAEEYPARGHFGHSSVEYAIGLGVRAGARKVALFHHDPDRTDDEIDRFVEQHADGSIEVTAAAEGTVIEL